MEPSLEISHSLEVKGDLYAPKITPDFFILSFIGTNFVRTRLKLIKKNKSRLRAF